MLGQVTELTYKFLNYHLASLSVSHARSGHGTPADLVNELVAEGVFDLGAVFFAKAASIVLRVGVNSYTPISSS